MPQIEKNNKPPDVERKKSTEVKTKYLVTALFILGFCWFYAYLTLIAYHGDHGFAAGYLLAIMISGVLVLIGLPLSNNHYKKFILIIIAINLSLGLILGMIEFNRQMNFNARQAQIKQAIANTKVDYKSDEIFYSERGRPIGITVSYSITFAKSGWLEPDIKIEPAAWKEFNTFSVKITPSPKFLSSLDPEFQVYKESPFYAFYKEGIKYDFSVVLVHPYLGNNNDVLCIQNNNEMFPETEFLKSKRYEISIGDTNFGYSMNSETIKWTLNSYIYKIYKKELMSDGVQNCP